MIRTVYSIIAALALGDWLARPVSGQCPNLTPKYAPVLATGYRSNLIATGLRSPRDITFDSAGNLLVVEQGTGSVRRLTLMESGGVVCVKSSSTLVADGTTNHGIALSADGKTLFLSTPSTVTAYSYDAVAGTAKNRRAVISNIPSNGGHITRTLLVSSHSPDVLLVTVGSNSNIDAGTVSKDSGRSMIKTFSIKGITTNPVNYTSGAVLGWGLRNLVGITEDPIHGGIWSVENSMDDVKYQGTDVHNNNPAERANYHGVLKDTRNPYLGKNYGYPSCVAVWDPKSFPGNVSSFLTGNLFHPDGTPPANDCSSRQRPRIAFPAHTAPMDIKFTLNGKKAYVSFRGSWDRSPPDGYRVMKVAFGPDGQPIAAANSQNGAVSIMSNQDLSKCPSGCFRPVGLAFDRRGRLYVASDSTGEIFVVYGA